MVFQTKFPTFTPDQFNKALTRRDFHMTEQSMVNPQNPQGPPLTARIFSKENLNVFLAANVPNQIIFQILNIVRLGKKYEDIDKILLDLNIFPDIILHATFNCITRSEAKTEPQSNLSSLMKSNFLKEISKTLGGELKVSSVRLSTTFPLAGEEALQIVMEPLGTSPRKEYFLNIMYQTRSMKNFESFIRRFGDDMIQEIIGQVEKSG